MKSDLDSLMAAQDLDALVILGAAHDNPGMFYLTGGVHLTDALLIQKRGESPLLFYHAMERDEAAKTGLRTRSFAPFSERMAETSGDMLQAMVDQWNDALAEAGVTSGRVSIHGNSEVGRTYPVLQALEDALPELEIVGYLFGSALEQAMTTKDETEVERIRRMGRITTEVVGLVADFLTSHRAKNGLLVKSEGQPLTVGEVKSRINLWLAERGAESPEDIIFAVGRDAGVPHSVGAPADLLPLGQTIVFDIFPRERGGGYYFDFTRTWCLGYAPDKVLSIYEDVLSAYRRAMAELKAGEPCPRYQDLVCELFEARGHPTVDSDPGTTSGYTHSLGHGLGLNIHERPMFRKLGEVEDSLEPGMVVTIEPGLYYPDRGMGVRLEDTVYIRPDGRPEILSEYPMDLVLPVHD